MREKSPQRKTLRSGEFHSLGDSPPEWKLKHEGLMVLMFFQKKIQLLVKILPQLRGGKIDRTGGGKGKSLEGALCLQRRVVFLKGAGQKVLRKLLKLGGVLGREYGAFRGRTRLSEA
jgi:hypothetical protein